MTGAHPTPDAGAPAPRVVTPTQLVWRRFRRHRLAMVGAVLTVALYVGAAFAPFLAPFGPNEYQSSYTYAPPQPVHWLRTDDDGRRIFGPYVYGLEVSIDYDSGRRVFETDEETVVPIRFFPRGAEYELFGFLPADRHLFGPAVPDQPMYLTGADRLGRDMFSRTLIGAQVSLSVGLVGVAASLVLGLIFGGLSGYYGGATDTLIQRVIEFLQSIPSIPLWIGLAAALPKDVNPVLIYFYITLILSLIGWTGLARVVRGRFLSLKNEDFVRAARLDGAGPWRVMFRHMVPSFLSHVIAAVTLAIPAMILAETALSFLGLGLRQPVISWGVLLQEAQNIRSVATAPWLFLPGGAVVVAVLSMNFLGDGLRDAADPFSSS
ncbi:MAG: ABC transporter permease [Trueperaceae bacterium]|nr:ABC transporter permease [Trueperaceae bacterium]